VGAGPDPLHIVCPACDTVNRIQTSRLDDRPTCGKCKQQLFTGSPVTLDERNFDKQITPATTFPWSWISGRPGAGPCKIMAPAFEEVAAELEPRVRLAKLNTEEATSVAAGNNIQSIPTLAIFDHGREVVRQAGAMPKPQLVQWVRATAG
jgi:thioredoxin 2